MKVEIATESHVTIAKHKKPKKGCIVRWGETRETSGQLYQFHALYSLVNVNIVSCYLFVIANYPPFFVIITLTGTYSI